MKKATPDRRKLRTPRKLDEKKVLELRGQGLAVTDIATHQGESPRRPSGGSSTDLSRSRRLWSDLKPAELMCWRIFRPRAWMCRPDCWIRWMTAF